MSDKPIKESSSKSSLNKSNENPPKQQEKPEQKPFNEFIKEHFLPGLTEALIAKGIQPNKLELCNGNRPVTGDNCWMIIGHITEDRRFWLCFNSDKITSGKTIAISEHGSIPTVLESFLIDERKITCALLVSRLLQRLNGQKWLGNN